MALLTAPITDDLLTNVRTMLGQPSAQNSTWTDEELTVYLNEGVRRYFTEVVTVAEGQFAAQVDLNIVSGVDAITLPVDFFKALIVYIARPDGSFEPLVYKNNLTEGYTTQGPSGNTAYTPWYYFRGNTLILRDVPQYSQIAGIRMEYIQFPATLVNGGDTMSAQVLPVFRDLIETYAIYKAKMRESLSNGINTYGPAKENLNDLYLSFKESITQRSLYPVYVTAFNPEN